MTKKKRTKKRKAKAKKADTPDSLKRLADELRDQGADVSVL